VFVGLTTLAIGVKNRKNHDKLVTFLKVCQFATQIHIETALYCLRIIDRGRVILLKDFQGQLELDESTKMPFWRVYLETTALTSSKSLIKSFLWYLFPRDRGWRKDKEKFKIIKSFIKVSYVSNLDKLVKENRFSILDSKNSDWFPGYFSRNIVQFQKLFCTTEVKWFIESLESRDRRMDIKSIIDQNQKVRSSLKDLCKENIGEFQDKI
jgi:hypothetical protein